MLDVHLPLPLLDRRLAGGNLPAGGQLARLGAGQGRPGQGQLHGQYDGLQSKDAVCAGGVHIL
ncbi:MAG: hypothetical protein ACOYMG_21950, partial [Candidatus Methylumidiphilus sp.]